MSVADQRAAARVLSAWFGWTQPYNLQRMQPGFSGGEIFRCQRENTTGLPDVWALKRLPSGTSHQRVAQVHRVIALARVAGCLFVPRVFQTIRGESFAVDGRGDFWELLCWMPGTPINELSAGELTDELLSAVGATLATLHSALSVSDDGEHGLGILPPERLAEIPAVVARRRRLTELGAMPEFSSTGSIGLSPAIADAAVLAGSLPPTLAAAVAAARSWLSTRWSTHVPEIMAALADCDPSPCTLQWVLRDVHSQHILVDFDDRRSDAHGAQFGDGAMENTIVAGRPGGFSASHQGGRVMGIIDFDAVQVDTRATDLARLVGSLGPPAVRRSEYWRPVLAGYRSVSPFSPEDETLAKTLSLATQWISLANWVVWVATEKKRFHAGENAVKLRVWDLLLRLQFMSN